METRESKDRKSREDHEGHEGFERRVGHGSDKGHGHRGGHNRYEGDGRHREQKSGEKYETDNHREESGRHREHGGGRPQRKGYRALVEKPGTHLLFIGSRSCTRHKGTVKLELQREGKLTFLILEEVDWITGGYLDLIEEAVREIAEELHPQHLVLFGGCQIELLSTDYETLTKELSRELGIEVRFHKGCHLVGYDPDAAE